MKLSNAYPLVVVVDDEEYILEFMKTDLEANGLEVKSFVCAKEALEFLLSNGKEEGACFFLITDYRMPSMSGLDMIEKLRNEAIDLVHSVLLTGLIPKEDLERASLMEGIEVMEKPVDLDSIVSMVKKSSAHSCDEVQGQKVL